MKMCFVSSLLLTLATIALPVLAESRVVDLQTSDGVNLKASYTSPGRTGPAMLLIHQCNMDRSSWNTISSDLVSAGIHVLALDLRGFGESGGEGLAGGFPTLLQKSAGDADRAFEYLISQSNVDVSRVGVGGASCGGMISADLAAREGTRVKALMLLSSPPSSNAIEHVANNPKLAVFAAATKQDPITRGVAGALESMVNSSANPGSVIRIFEGREHGLPMFSSNPTLQTELLAWLKEQLLSK